MRITHPILALAACFSGTVLAVPQAAGATCFDAGDCILAGGGQCNKPATALLGTCGAAGAAATPVGSMTPSKASSAPKSPAGSTAPKATGAVCFDAGDCILSGGGQCNKAAGALTGNCGK